MTLVLAGGSTFKVQEYLESPIDFYQSLDKARQGFGHAICLCTRPGRQLVVREVRGVLYLAVWPNDGHLHAPGCHFHREEVLDAAAEQASSLPRATRAVQLDSAGLWDINVELPRFTKGAVAPIPRSAPNKPAAALHPLPRSGRDALTLPQFFAWLWDSTSLARWGSGWRRDWWTVERTIRSEAQAIHIQGAPLSSTLYVPPHFRKDKEAEIHAEFDDYKRSLAGRAGNYGLVLCELKSIDKSEFGFKASVKHMAKPIYFGAELYANLQRTSALQLAMLKTRKEMGCSVLAFLVVEVTSKGNLVAVDAALMLTSAVFIPVSTIHELTLCNLLVAESRTFTRGIGKHQGADFVLRDVKPPVAMIVYSLQSIEYIKARDEVVALCLASGCDIWKWHQSSGAPIPPLPRRI